MDISRYIITALGYQKFLHPLGVQEVTPQKSSDNTERLAGCRMVLQASAGWGPTLLLSPHCLKISVMSLSGPPAGAGIFDNPG